MVTDAVLRTIFESEFKDRRIKFAGSIEFCEKHVGLFNSYDSFTTRVYKYAGEWLLRVSLRGRRGGLVTCTRPDVTKSFRCMFSLNYALFCLLERLGVR